LFYLESILNKQEIQEIRKRWSKSGNFNEIFNSEIQDKLDTYFKEKQENFNNSIQILSKFGINLNLLEDTSEDAVKSNTEKIRKTRKDIEFMQNIIKLLSVTAQEVSSGKFDRDNNEEDIYSVINFLTSHIATNNSKEAEKTLYSLLSRKDMVSQNGEVAVFITDNPYILLNIGKYPPGTGSCQNYESGGLNKALLGYVGDSKSKAILVLKLDKLSKETQEIIKTQGINGIYNTQYEAEVLEAILGRAIIKLGSIKSVEGNQEVERPTILIQPTYTSVNKADTSLNQIVIDSVIDGYAQDLGTEVYITTGPTPIQQSQSRSPVGEYDDGNNNGIGIGVINRQYQVTATKVY
jgi:hypothetical protein